MWIRIFLTFSKKLKVRNKRKKERKKERKKKRREETNKGKKERKTDRKKERKKEIRIHAHKFSLSPSFPLHSTRSSYAQK